MCSKKNDLPSISALKEEKTMKEQSKIEIYNVVLNKCIQKIIYTNRHTDQTFIIFEVPKLLIGYPSYDMKSCILFLINKLSSKNYLVDFIDPFYLYIDWGSAIQNRSQKMPIVPSPMQDKLKSQTRQLLQQFPDTSKVEFVYADDVGVSSKRGKKNAYKKKR